MKKNTKIIVVFIAVILIFTASFLIWKSSTPMEDKEIIDILEVNYRKASDVIIIDSDDSLGIITINSDFAPVTIYSTSLNSEYVISATVSELKNTDGNKECYLDVNKVLKGNIEVNQILLKTREKEPELKEGDEYILFIVHYEQNNTDYYHLMRDGYLIKNGSVYEGMTPSKSFTYIGIKSRLFFTQSFVSFIKLIFS